MVEIQINGVDELLAKLGAAQGKNKLREPMDKALKLIEREMKIYPDQRPGSKYRRTLQLKKHWTTAPIQETANGLIGKVGNNVEDANGNPYAPFVQSQQFQAQVHRGRWQTDAQVLNQERPTIERYFQEAIDKALNAEI